MDLKAEPRTVRTYTNKDNTATAVAAVHIFKLYVRARAKSNAPDVRLLVIQLQLAA
jgi:hypothetical protein